MIQISERGGSGGDSYYVFTELPTSDLEKFISFITTGALQGYNSKIDLLLDSNTADAFTTFGMCLLTMDLEPTLNCNGPIENQNKRKGLIQASSEPRIKLRKLSDLTTNSDTGHAEMCNSKLACRSPSPSFNLELLNESGIFGSQASSAENNLQSLMDTYRISEPFTSSTYFSNKQPTAIDLQTELICNPQDEPAPRTSRPESHFESQESTANYALGPCAEVMSPTTPGSLLSEPQAVSTPLTPNECDMPVATSDSNSNDADSCIPTTQTKSSTNVETKSTQTTEQNSQEGVVNAQNTRAMETENLTNEKPDNVNSKGSSSCTKTREEVVGSEEEENFLYGQLVDLVQMSRESAVGSEKVSPQSHVELPSSSSNANSSNPKSSKPEVEKTTELIDLTCDNSPRKKNQREPMDVGYNLRSNPKQSLPSESLALGWQEIFAKNKCKKEIPGNHEQSDDSDDSSCQSFLVIEEL